MISTGWFSDLPEQMTGHLCCFQPKNVQLSRTRKGLGALGEFATDEHVRAMWNKRVVRFRYTLPAFAAPNRNSRLYRRHSPQGAKRVQARVQATSDLL